VADHAQQKRWSSWHFSQGKMISQNQLLPTPTFISRDSVGLPTSRVPQNLYYCTNEDMGFFLHCIRYFSVICIYFILGQLENNARMYCERLWGDAS
jgi:hypothetical protein